MEFRRHNDIVAFKWKHQAPVAFHARNLEVAEISEESWNDLLEGAKPSEALNQIRTWEQEDNPEVKSGKLEVSIRSLTINVTQICNLKCTYCAAGGDGTYGSAQTKIDVEKTLPQLKFFLEKIPAGGAFKIVFLGGEPLLYPEGIRAIGNYVRLMTAGQNIRAIFSIVTNGTLLNDKNLEILKDLKANITISVDGPAETNDLSRPSKDGLSTTAKIINGLHKLSKIKDDLGTITLHGVFNKSNLDIVSAYEFYTTSCADKYEFTYSVEENDQESNQTYVNQMNLIAAKAFKKGGESELRKIAIFDHYFSALDNQQSTENHCGAGKSFLMVDAKNNLFTCPWEVGNKDEQLGQGTDVDYSRMERENKSLIEKNNCNSCWARFLCGGGCMFIHKKGTGDKHKKDGQFCFRTRSLISTTLMYYKNSRLVC